MCAPQHIFFFIFYDLHTYQNGSIKKHLLFFYKTNSTDGVVLYEVVKNAIGDLKLNLEYIVGQCFNWAANISKTHKGLATRMKECSPVAIHIIFYEDLLNLAIQDSITRSDISLSWTSQTIICRTWSASKQSNSFSIIGDVHWACLLNCSLRIFASHGKSWLLNLNI